MSLLRLIASRNFITVNKDLMQLLGLEEAVLLGELSSEYEYWRAQDKLDDGWFYSTVENVEENTTLTKYKQKKALDNLQRMGILEVQRKGIPAKRYIRINEGKLCEIFFTNQNFVQLEREKMALNKDREKKICKILSNKKSKNLTTRSQKISLLEVKKFAPNKNKEKEIKNNISKENKKERSAEIEKVENVLFLGNKNKSQLENETKDKNKDQSDKNSKCENNSQSLSKKKTSLENQKSFNELIDSYTENPELRRELKEHLKTRKAKRAALSNRAIELSLKKLDELTCSTKEKIKIVQNSIINGWTSFYPLSKDELRRLDRPSYDLSKYEDEDDDDKYYHLHWVEANVD